MINTKLAKKVLTKKNQKHLTKMGIHSMSQFLSMREKQLAIPKTTGIPGIDEPCYECLEIARKLKTK